MMQRAGHHTKLKVWFWWKDERFGPFTLSGIHTTALTRIPHWPLNARVQIMRVFKFLSLTAQLWLTQNMEPLSTVMHKLSEHVWSRQNSEIRGVKALVIYILIDGIVHRQICLLSSLWLCFRVRSSLRHSTKPDVRLGAVTSLDCL